MLKLKQLGTNASNMINKSISTLSIGIDEVHDVVSDYHLIEQAARQSTFEVRKQLRASEIINELQADIATSDIPDTVKQSLKAKLTA